MEEKREKSALEILAEKNGVEEKYAGEQEDFSAREVSGRKALFFVVLFGILLIAAFVTVFLFSGNGGKRESGGSENLKINDFKEFARGRLSGNIKSAMNVSKRKGQPAGVSAESAEQTEIQPEKNRPKAGQRNRNGEKDREILENYAKLSDAAASSNQVTNRKRRFVPGGEGKGGGVFLKGEKKEEGKRKSLDLHDVKVKAKLDFSIRSTAQSTVVATVTEEIGEIPKGAKFYGSAKSFVNKRTQLAFSKLIVGGEEFSVKGFAVSGKDPGIESEVTDIAGENVKSEVKRGLTKTAGTLISGLSGGIGGAVGTAANNTVNPAASELEKQEEANKMKQEYRVPAGTSFFVYIE